MQKTTILVTGSPGFIGAHLVIRLLREMNEGIIISLDNMNTYYDTALKEYRKKLIEQAAKNSGAKHIFFEGDISSKDIVDYVFHVYQPDIVINLAAQAGVRYSIENPDAYVSSNVIGFFNMLEACRKYPVKHMLFASSSSVYGDSKNVPFSVDDKTDQPVSLYAATKKTDELFAYSYAKLYGIPCTGLRFFTVYGPAGRPDMFYYSATEKLIAGKDINLFNFGNCMRDFTYIDDIIEGLFRIIQKAPGPDKETGVPYRIYNIGGGSPVNLMDFINTLLDELMEVGMLPKDYDRRKHIRFVPMQPGDVTSTYADTKALEQDFYFRPRIDIREGLHQFVDWYRKYAESNRQKGTTELNA